MAVVLDGEKIFYCFYLPLKLAQLGHGIVDAEGHYVRYLRPASPSKNTLSTIAVPGLNESQCCIWHLFESDKKVGEKKRPTAVAFLWFLGRSLSSSVGSGRFFDVAMLASAVGSVSIGLIKTGIMSAEEVL